MSTSNNFNDKTCQLVPTIQLYVCVYMYIVRNHMHLCLQEFQAAINNVCMCDCVVTK